MLRILFIGKYKNTKANNFKALNIGKMILRIVKLKIWLMVIQLMNLLINLLYNCFKSTISSYRGFRMGKIKCFIAIL